MSSINQTGRIIGILFLLIFIIGMTSMSYRGLSSSLAESDTFLKSVHDDALEMKLAILLDVLSSIVGITIAVILFPLLKKYSKSLALTFLVFWSAQLAVVISSNVSHLSLISLSNEFVSGVNVSVQNITLLGKLAIEDYYWAHYFIIILFNVGGLIIHYLFYRSKLIPTILSVGGMLTAGLAIIGILIQYFEITHSMYFFMPNGLLIIALSLWLIIKGFNSGILNDSSVEINGITN